MRKESRQQLREDGKKPGQGILRRTVLVSGLAAATALMLPHDEEKQTPNNWDFLEEAPNRKKDQGPNVGNIYPQYGPEFRILQGDPRIERVLTAITPNLEDRLRTHGLDPNHKPEATVWQRYYGVPLKVDTAKRFVAYAKQLLLYMHERIPDLGQIAVRWTPLKAGVSHTKDFDNCGFIGEQYFDQLYVELRQPTITEKFVQIHITEAIPGGHGQYYNNTTPPQQFIFVGQGGANIVISEVLPLYLISTLEKHQKSGDMLTARRAMETASEVPALLLAREYGKIVRIPNIDAHIEHQLTRMQLPMYQDVPHALAWASSQGKDGPANLVRMYKDSTSAKEFLARLN